MDKVKFIRGVSGYWKGRSYRYSRGSEPSVVDSFSNQPGAGPEILREVAADHVRCGNAERVGEVRKVRTLFIPPEAVTPEITEAEVKKAVIKKRKRV